ncbi:hypothetical protein [Bacillus cereus]|uniref:Uncharacterized protein n=1 Tax=Bacillus cereus TaxID=1396 RepID=A0A2A7HUA2_BACCE|nr:hypothetical protein [Bacillus cereus]PEC20561.1 hypothetical protein COM96_18810 [Bacillus cereus]
MSDIQSQLKLATKKVELLKALAEVEAPEAELRKGGMFRTVDLAANVASPRDCQYSCFECSELAYEPNEELARNASPALLASMKAELKTTLAVEAQEAALQKGTQDDDKA